MNSVRQKILSLEELATKVAQVRNSGQKTVLCHGVFDLIHPGHIRHLESARREGDVLIVSLTADAMVNRGPGRPVFNERLRAETIAALECVDYVVVCRHPTAVSIINELQPNVYVKGPDYAEPDKNAEGNIRLEMEAAKKVGGRIHFTEELLFSSTQLLNDYFSIYPPQTENFLNEFKQKFTADDIIERFESLRNLRVLVVGEVIVDEYHYCKGIGKSPKDSIIVSKHISDESFGGGSIACANHLAEYCNEVHLLSVVGGVESREDVIEECLNPRVKRHFFKDPGACTIVKRRYVDPDFMHKLFEICYLPNPKLEEAVEREIIDYLSTAASEFDMVLVTDFGHGMLSENVIKTLTKTAKFLAVNTQTNSANTGYNVITKYPRADYVCIDEPELRLATYDRIGPLEPLVKQVVEKTGASRVTITRGHNGALTYRTGDHFHETPIFSTRIVDRTGAGDAFLSVTAPCVAAEFPMELIGFIGNAVGAMAVQIVCNRSPVKRELLFKFIQGLLK
ncbi:MAG: cytidyltransferase [Deltaproteobacteria bacterium CG11_big_fil_rev_8_21_14_0_20_47_16]|nr:MAG: cytidyltransferase [Deltaproteobacteria bacterium CG11_big_fil_rev_8_21_14_0_20_47_16]